MPAIFISHSSLDTKVADDIKSTLAKLGFDRVFLDFDKETGIGAGENWEKRLYEELSRCHAVMSSGCCGGSGRRITHASSWGGPLP